MPSDTRAISVQKMAKDSLLSLLRKATHDIHERLHVHPVTAPLLLPSLTRAHYIDVLRAFYGFHKPLEAKAPSYRQISRAGLIRQDLDYLGDKAEVPLCFELPALEASFERLGYWYVVEGSSLGSALIYKHLQKHLGLNADMGARFFYAYGKETGRNWNEFKAFLYDQNLTQDAIGQATNAAMETFSCLEKWLWHCHRRMT